MAFNPQEESIIQYGIQNGKTKDQIKQSIGNFRAGITTPKPVVEKPVSIQGENASFTDKVKSGYDTYSKGVENFLQPAADSIKSGIDKTVSGYQQAVNSSKDPNILSGLGNLAEGSVKMTAGVIDTAFSGMAPLLAPIGKAINFISDKISDDPNVQEFAKSKAGEITKRIAEDISNLNTIFGAVAPIEHSLNTPPASPETISVNKITGSNTGETISDMKGRAEVIKNRLTRNPETAVHNSLGRKITEPVKLFENKDGSYSIFDGNHRVTQALINGDKNIPAILTDENGNILGKPFKTSLDDISSSFQKAVSDFSNKTKQGFSDTTSTIANKTGEVVGNLREKVMGTPESDLQKIKDMISPKPTIKEAKLATEQGRLYKGKEPTNFKSGTPDQVATSDQQFKSTQTINKLIPDAAKMDEPTLYTTLKEKIGEVSQKLKPEMEKVKIKDETVQKITDDFEKLKKTQISEAKATDEPNVAKWQNNFEKYLQKSKGGNMNDLWETRQAYDDSIKANVKNATEQSAEDLQTQKDIWLQNRRILTNAINDTENGLGETSRSAFSDMTDLYEAKNGILSKAKIELQGKPSKIKQVIEKHPIIKAGVKATGAGAGLQLLP